MTIIIPAHNEETVIGNKLESILSQDFPRERLEIIVASDVSTDRTNEIVRGFAERGVTLVEFKERHGKLGALDELIPLAKNEIVVITDANVFLAPNALKKIAEAYRDPRVGVASGFQTVELPGRATPLREEVWYRSFEAKNKNALSRIGLMVGAFGGFYSIRRQCFRAIGPKPMEDDITLPLEAIAQGYRSVFVKDAVGYEELGGTITEEYRRRIRMTAYNLNAAGRAIRLAAKRGLLALYVVLSYKIIRWLSPGFWILSVVASAFLFGKSPIYSAAAFIFTAGIAAAIIGMVGAAAGKRWGVFTQAYYFAVMNFASLPGLILWLKGVQRFWAPRAG